MRVERGQLLVEPDRVVVVEQQPHPHAAVGRSAQGAEQQRAGLVVVPDVVLHVERALGGARKQHARSERVEPVGQRMDAGAARMRGGQRCDRGLECTVVHGAETLTQLGRRTQPAT